VGEWSGVKYLIGVHEHNSIVRITETEIVITMEFYNYMEMIKNV